MKKLKLPVMVLAVLFLAANAPALEIISAAPVKTPKGQTADFVLSGSITVKGIAFEKGAVVMPVTENKGRTYTDIKLLSKGLYSRLEGCFAKGKCASAGPYKLPELAVSKVQALKSPKRVANVTLAFDGDLVVTFGAIKKYSGDIFAAYPDNFEVNDEALKGLIEKKVAEGYQNAGKDAKPAADKEKVPAAGGGPAPKKASK